MDKHDAHCSDLIQLQMLLRNIAAAQQRIVEESARLAAQIQALMPHLGTQSLGGRQPYEFFRASNGWQIRFDGEIIHTGRNDKGLLYIHKLLMYPERRFSPSELDPTVVDLNRLSLFAASESISVELPQRLQSVNPNSAEDCRNALRDLSRRTPDKQDPLDQHIYYWSEMCYLAESLKNLDMQPRHIEAYKAAKEKLDDLVFQLKQEYDDEHFVARVLRESGKIRSTARDSEDIPRKMRDRITKNIKNAIDGLKNDVLKAYFNERLEIGSKSVYHPDPAHPIHWQLEDYG